MTSPTTNDADGPEDVNNFLSRIRELGEKRDKEDVDRTKKLEDEILQGRKERQARRAGNSLCPFPSPRVMVDVYYDGLASPLFPRVVYNIILCQRRGTRN